MRCPSALFAAAVLAMLPACHAVGVVSVHPLFDDRAAIWDARLAGTWIAVDDDSGDLFARLLIERVDTTRQYRLWVPGQDSNQTLLTLGDIDGARFADYYSLRVLGRSPDDMPADHLLLPVHAMSKVLINGDTLLLPFLTTRSEAFGAALWRDVAHTILADSEVILLTGPSDEVRRFLAAHAGDSLIFRDTLVYIRLPELPSERPGPFASLSSGTFHTCGLARGGAAYCWGRNDEGQLGNGRFGNSASPVRVAAPSAFREVAAGGDGACGWVAGGLHCWGVLRNDERSTVPWTEDSAGLSSLVVGEYYACGLRADGVAYCWYGAPEGIPDTVRGGIAFRSLGAFGYERCGVSADGAVYCWGPGTAPMKQSLAPVGIVSGSGGGSHTCGIGGGGAVYCWGGNRRGQLGVGDSLTHDGAVPVAGGLTFRTLSAGEGHTCGLTTAGRAYCWGANQYGQLGRGDTSVGLAPAPVAGRHTFRTLTSGSYHTCGLTAEGLAHCWGDNRFGQLGIGGARRSTVPVPVAVAVAGDT